jgi:hypothetical protein
MSSFPGLEPLTGNVPSPEMVNDAIERENNRGFRLQVIPDALMSEQSLAFLIRQYDRSSYASVDPTYSLTTERIKDLTQGIEPQFWEMFDDALNADHAQIIRDQALDLQERRQRLTQAGWTGTAARFGAAVLDPVALAIDAGVTTTAGPIAAVARRGTIMARMAAGGLIAAASNVPVQAYISSQDPEQDEREVMYALGGSLLLGGGAWALQGARIRKAVELEFAMGAAAAKEFDGNWRKVLSEDILTKEGNATFRPGVATPEKAAAIDSMIRASGLDSVKDADFIAELRAMDPDAALGVVLPPQQQTNMLMGVPDSAVGMKATDFSFANANGQQTGTFSAWRFSMGSKSQSVDDEMGRALSAKLMDTVIPGKGGGVVVASAAEQKERMLRVFQTEFAREANPLFKEWQAQLREGSVARLWNSTADNERFYRLVGQELLRRQDGSSFDNLSRGRDIAGDAIGKAADLFDRQRRKILDFAVRHNVPGMDTIDPAKPWFMVSWSARRIRNAEAAIGRPNLVRIFADSFTENLGDLPDNLRLKVADGFLGRISSLDYNDLDRMAVFTDRQAAKTFLSNIEGLPADKVDEIARLLSDFRPEAKTGELAQIGDAKFNNRAKRRTPLNYTQSHYVNLPDGSQKRFDLSSLMEDNAAAVLDSFTQQMVGAAASSRVLAEMNAQFGLQAETMGGLLSSVSKRLQARGINPREVTDAVDRLTAMANYVEGKPMHLGSQSAVSDVLRIARAANYVRLSGGFAIANITDPMNLLTQGGVSALINNVPAFKSLISRAKSGKLSNELLAEIEAMAAPGTDRLTRQLFNRMSLEDSAYRFGGGKFGRLSAWADKKLAVGARISNDISFLSTLNMASQRAAALTAAHNITSYAYRFPEGLPSAKWVNRMAEIGLSEADAKIVFAQIRKHTITEPGWLTGRKIKRLDIDSWSDQRAAQLFVNAIDKWSRTAVQDNSVSSLAKWMTTDLGRTMLQFRTFNVVAWEKSLLQGVNRLRYGDMQQVGVWLGGILFSGLTYVARTQIDSVGMDEVEKADFLDRRLTNFAIGANAFGRSNMSSLLPDIVDTAASHIGIPGVFGNTRASGLTRLLTSFPTLDLVNKGASTTLLPVAKGINYIQGEPTAINQKDFDNFRSLLAWQRVMGVKQLLNYVGSQFEPAPQ